MVGRSLPTYTPTLSNRSSTGVLVPDNRCSHLPQRTSLSQSGNGYLVSGCVSGLDAFSPYRLRRGCPALPYRTTGRLVATAPCSSRTKSPLPSGNRHSQQIESDLFRVNPRWYIHHKEEGFFNGFTPPNRLILYLRFISRRSKPSSRSPLIGEQPHPWRLLHHQDGKNRHRGSKPRGRCGLLPATTLYGNAPHKFIESYSRQRVQVSHMTLLDLIWQSEQ